MGNKIQLKGLYKVPMKLKDGSVRVYYYSSRKNGKPIVNAEGIQPEFGTPEFLSIFLALTTAKAEPEQPRTFADLIDDFQKSSDYTDKADKTRVAYAYYCRLIRAKFGSLPMEALKSPKMRGAFKTWRDSMIDQRRKADFCWQMLRRLCSFAIDRGELTTNPCAKGGRLYKADRNEKIWTEEHLLQLFGAASTEVAAAVTVALWTGQRMTDCLEMKWSDLQVGKIRVKQNKGGRRVLIPIGAPLAELIAKLPKTDAGTILTNSRGLAWTTDGFKTSYGRAFARSGIVDDLHFHDLRGTAVTRMGLAGCTAIQIAAVTGHDTKRVDDILGAHYLGGQVELAEQAITKLEARSA